MKIVWCFSSRKKFRRKENDKTTQSSEFERSIWSKGRNRQYKQFRKGEGETMGKEHTGQTVYTNDESSYGTLRKIYFIFLWVACNCNHVYVFQASIDA